MYPMIATNRAGEYPLLEGPRLCVLCDSPILFCKHGVESFFHQDGHQ